MAQRWKSLVTERPEIAEIGHRLLYQGRDIASAYLATVAADLRPRVHPVFPILTADDLWLFIVNLSPKYRDLKRNGQFALHSSPTAAGGEEFYIRGRAQEIEEDTLRAQVIDASQGRQGTQPFESLFRCRLESILYTRWENWGTEQAWPTYSKWFAPA